MGKSEHLSHLWNAYQGYKKGTEVCQYPPLRIWLEPTNYCNLRCPFCPQSSPRPVERGYMGYELYQKIIREAKGNAYDINLCHRGESLFHKRIIDMIILAREAGLKTRLHTNATIMDEEMSRELLRSRLDLISFSFDGFEKETYERLRVNAHFEKTLNNILNFLRLKQKLRLKKPYTIFQTIDSGDEVSPGVQRDFIRQFDRLLLDRLYIKLPHNWGGNIPEERVAAAKRKPYSPCTFCWYSMTILWDGTVLPCPQDYFAEIPLGSLLNSSLMEVWNGEAMVSLRRSFITRNYDHISPCKSCDRLWRKTLLGIPTINMKTFLKENLLGYKLMRRWFKRVYREKEV